MKLRKWLIVFVLGAVIGPVGDWTHVQSGTITYAATDPRLRIFFGLPYWVPLLFGYAAVMIAITQQLLNKKSGHPSHRTIVQGTIAFLTIYALSGFLPYPTGGSRDVMLALGALATWGGLERSARGFAVGLVIAACGTLTEMFLVHHGVFSYTPGSGNLYGVPSWLPSLYFAASVAVGNLQRRIR